jgi:hypothetical protein
MPIRSLRRLVAVVGRTMRGRRPGCWSIAGAIRSVGPGTPCAMCEHGRESAMTDTPEVVREPAEHHAKEAERLLKSWRLSTT